MILFFCPILASSPNQTSTSAGLRPCLRAMDATRSAKPFFKLPPRPLLARDGVGGLTACDTAWHGARGPAFGARY